MSGGEPPLARSTVFPMTNSAEEPRIVLLTLRAPQLFRDFYLDTTISGSATW